MNALLKWMAALPLVLLSQAQADPATVKLIKKQYGGVIDQAVSKAIGGVTYVAYARRPYKDGEITVTVSRKVGSSYVKVWSENLGMLDSTSQEFGDLELSDANNDKKPEVLFSITGHGNSIEGQDFYFVDVLSQKKYTSNIQGAYGSSYAVNYDPALLGGNKEAFLKFVSSRVMKSPMYEMVEAGAPSTPETRWTEQYGAFAAGERQFADLKPEWLTGEACNLNRPGTFTSRKALGKYEFVAMFKGPVVALEKDKKRCFIVFMPNSVYDWIDPLEVKGPELLMHDRTTGKVVAKFNPSSFRLSR